MIQNNQTKGTKMQKISLFTLTAATAVIMGGCAQTAPSPLDSEECATLQKKIVQTDQFIKKVSAMDPAHADEMMMAIPKTEITTETTKPKMLRDAKRRKARLEQEFNMSGCKKEE